MNTTLTSTLRVYDENDGSRPLVDTTDRAEIARILGAEKILFEQWDADAPLTAERIKRINSYLEMQRHYIAEVPKVRVALPDVTFNDSLILQRGRRTIELHYLGLGNTRARLAHLYGSQVQSDVAQAIDLGYRIVLARPPSPKEKDAALTYVGGDAAHLKGFTWLLFNLDEFSYAR